MSMSQRSFPAAAQRRPYDSTPSRSHARSDNDGKTALHEAAEDGEVAALKVLIGAGADLNAQDNDGKTALQTPTVSKYIEAILALGWTPPHNE